MVVIEEEVMIPAADFDETDLDKNDRVCVKDTPSATLVMKEANENTPSQPCPPPFLLKGKAEAIKIQKEWLLEDDNRNGAVCVKETGAGKFIVKDDNEATPSQPCPPAYMAIATGKQAPGPKIPVKLFAEADDNRNGTVCWRLMEESKNFVIKDDNPDLPSQPCPPAYSIESDLKKASEF
jgi:hypothetical protein